MPVDWQIFISFFQIDCYRNVAFLIKIAALAEIGYKIID